LWWAIGRTLYASVLNDIDDYDTLTNTDADSWSATVSQTMDDISAIHNYGGHIQLFTPSALFEIYGTKPSTYEVVPINAGIGCPSRWGLVEANGYLYFYDQSGIYQYNGARYTKISSAVDAYINAIPAAYQTLVTLAADDKYLYCAIPYGAVTANNLLLKYDFMRQLWFVDTGAFIDMTSFPKKAIGLTSDGKIWTMQYGTADTPYTGAATAVSWDWISKAFTTDSIKDEITLDYIKVSIYLPTGSSATMKYSTAHDGTSGFTTMYTFSASSSVQNVLIDAASSYVYDANWFRLELTGSGPCDVHYIEIGLRGQHKE
jgi:hypothetical protein